MHRRGWGEKEIWNSGIKECFTAEARRLKRNAIGYNSGESRCFIAITQQKLSDGYSLRVFKNQNFIKHVGNIRRPAVAGLLRSSTVFQLSSLSELPVLPVKSFLCFLCLLWPTLLLPCVSAVNFLNLKPNTDR